MIRVATAYLQVHLQQLHLSLFVLNIGLLVLRVVLPLGLLRYNQLLILFLVLLYFCIRRLQVDRLGQVIDYYGKDVRQ